ncbi:MAG TPA: alpha-L-arabinofuranosidase C-terminal domain-containing protein [Candidatus Acidoferrales bacterium]|nr:alpha-L-arabinofuranosidase C-terminal domain-containing protein [Candidatus Acidoferrales bacterium]
MNLTNYFAAVVLASAISTKGQTAKITVDAAHPAHPISPVLWGIFFEDINMSADGGIYPELVRNLSFEDADTPENWKFAAVGGGQSEASIVTSDVHGQPPPLNAFNRKSLRVKLAGAFTLQNEGYWGMNIVKGDDYTFKVAARGEKFEGALTVKVLSSNGVVLAGGNISGIGRDWEYHRLNLTASGSDPGAKLEISGDGQGVLFLDMVSLMPARTWKAHGLRTDLAESLQELHPAFMRFPGGCWVEGDDFAHMNHWKNTIGNIDTRTPLWNIWGYYATHGLGFYEYLQLAEDLHAEPLFDINVGMSHKETVPMDRMAQWAQDALDAVEYANGPTNSVWGAMRTAAGHPAPFNLKYIEIGNEDGGPDYVHRWPVLVNALRDKYPYLKFIMNTDLRGRPYPDDPPADIVDEHYYDSPEWFMLNANHYDNYDRKSPKIFVGEYAVTRNCGLGNLRGAIGEAAFMTGLERNSDQVIMASYAPLLVNLNHRAWNPDLINFDSSRWYGLPGYYVQRMFAENRGDVYLPTDVQTPLTEPAPSGGMIGVGTWNTAAEFRDIKVTAPDGRVLLATDFDQGATGWKMLGNGANWKTQDGALRQTAERQFIRALAGDKSWKDYTLTLKARKISGAEGFLILFNINGNDDRTWWNIGGWENTADGIEAGGTTDSKPEQIETGRWYDIRMEVRGKHVKCFLDGRRVHDLDFEPDGRVKALYACAARDSQNGDVIVKVVNASTKPVVTQLELGGANNLAGTGTATVLTSASGTDENSLDDPQKVSPKTEPVSFNGTTMERAFPGNSLTVLRLRTK